MYLERDFEGSRRSSDYINMQIIKNLGEGVGTRRSDLIIVRKYGAPVATIETGPGCWTQKTRQC